MTIGVLGAVAPMLQASWFPLTRRLVHGWEITADCIGHALIIAWLLGKSEQHAQALEQEFDFLPEQC